MSDTTNIKALLDSDTTLARRPSLGEEAAEKLREMILLEKFPPGTALPETELSKALGISRTPLREAMRLLEIDGLVEHSDTRRARVAAPSLEELAQNLMVLGALEGLAGEQVCLNATQAQLDLIANLNKRMIEEAPSADPLSAFRLDMEFHRAIVLAAANPSLLETHRQYNARLWRARFISSKRRAHQETKRVMHQSIVDALLARDQNAASNALRRHLDNAVRNIDVAMKEQSQGPIDNNFTGRAVK